jgi:diguanylate cyclase
VRYNLDHGAADGTAAHLPTDLAAELDRRVRTDALTALASKPQMVEWLDEAPAGSLLALIDLDDFRLLNQTLGHDSGDHVLTSIARRLESACPAPGHRVCRISQDEFAVLRVGVAARAEELLAHLSAVFADPVRIGDRVVGVRATAGISTCAAGKSANTVIREADTAMYEAKTRAKGAALVFDEVFHQRAAATFEIVEGLRRSLRSGEGLHVHYQPEVDLGSGRLVAAEALLRWDHPVLGSVPPSEFIPIAEASGLIAELGELVLSTALTQRRQWLMNGVVDDDFTVAVNVSARQLEDPDFVELVRWELETGGCPPGRLCLELTESALMADPAEAVARLNRLAELGIGLAIDDFGTGYSSLAYLQHLPITQLKIDRSFVSRSAEPRGAALLEATMGIARALGLGTIGEGIETPQQLSLLRSLGCGTGQGYHLARPAPAAGFPEAIAAAERHRVGRPRLALQR